MSERTKIAWTDATWNPVTGCTKVSTGCKNCYAERDWARLSKSGESGPKARPMHPDWVRSIRDQCNGTGTPFFFKQWGEWSPFNTRAYRTGVVSPDGWRSEDEPYGYGRYDRGEKMVWRVGKKAAGKLLDGRVWEEMPAISRKGEA